MENDDGKLQKNENTTNVCVLLFLFIFLHKKKICQVHKEKKYKAEKTKNI